jgi:hypothetical protein
MPKCNKCKTIYNEPQRQKLLANKMYWCLLCSSVYKIFNPFPYTYFAPEVSADDVISRQLTFWEAGKKDGWFKVKK